MRLVLPFRSGRKLNETVIPTSFTHDAVKFGDSVFIADTGKGRIVELHWPSLRFRRAASPFTQGNHVNTVAAVPTSVRNPEGDDFRELIALLHNKGRSELYAVDMATGRATVAHPDVGRKAHNVVALDDGSLLVLSSEEGKLLQLNRTNVHEPPRTLWEEGSQTFIKGMSVICGVAYVGVSSFGPRHERASLTKVSEVAAVRLEDGSTLWRKQVNTSGMLNAISAPHVSEESTYAALGDWGYGTGCSRTASGSVLTKSASRPLIPLEQKRQAAEGKWRMGLQSWNVDFRVDIGQVDVTALREKLHDEDELWDNQETNALLEGREANARRFKPGVQTIHLVFSDRAAEQTYGAWWLTSHLLS